MQREIGITLGEALLAKMLERAEAMLEEVERQVQALYQENEALKQQLAAQEKAGEKQPDEPAK